MRLTICNHRKKTAAGVHIFLVRVEVRGKFFDPLRQDSNLHFRRARILVMDSNFLDELLLLGFR